jgi:hypothetical protein
MMMLQFLAHDRLSLILSLLANALSGDGEDDDEGVMCWRNECPFPLCFLALSLFSCGLLLRLILAPDG